MISVSNLNVRYGDKHLFTDVSVRLNDQDRVGLVGVNGAGKSTLLKIMCGLQESEPGVVNRPKQATAAYLPQEAGALDTGRTIYREAESAFAGELALQKELDRVNHRLASAVPESSEFAALLQRQGDLQHRLERSGIYRIRTEIEKVLAGLGFSVEDLGRDCRTLSGGWLMRLLLAKLLLARPAMLFLDEPTNHLDLESLTWLEDFLQDYDGALVIISHDRTFLDRITTITWELSLGRLTVFKGNYSQYLLEKEQRLEVERAAYANQQARIRQTMRFVRRFRAKSTKASQVQSRLKQLDKMERVELSESEREVQFRFPPAAACGKEVLEVADLRKDFDGRSVFSGLGFHLRRGDKLAVVGVNGAGKSTLVRLLAGLTEPDGGSVRYGRNVTVSYFGQHQAQELSPELTVLESMAPVAGDMPVSRLRSLLGAFLFRDEDADKKVEVLSGGEKSRLALARMIVQPANLLILDEPTNHLDMTSQEVLQDALAQYDGCIIIVSHNRYFMNRFVNRVLEIREGAATLYEGNIDDYLYRRRKEIDDRPKKGAETGQVTDQARNGRADRKEIKRREARLRQEKSRRLAPLRKNVERAEREIEALEQRKKALEQTLADPELYRDAAAFAESSREYSTVRRRLDRWYYKWQEAQEEMEKIEGKCGD